MSDTETRAGSLSAGPFVVCLVVVAVLLVGIRWLVTPDTSRRNLEFFPDMATSPAVESQSIAAALPGGLSQQPLVAGVVVRGAIPLRYGADEEEAKRAGRELTNPVPPDAASLERGAEVFRIHCSTCHGIDGAGQGPAVLRGMLPPPALGGANAVQMPDGQMFHLLTFGRGNMPALADRLATEDRWRAVLHVRALQAPPPEEEK